MKKTFLDRTIGFFSPSAELHRIQSRIRTELSLRAYEIADTYAQSDWIKATGSSANTESKAAVGPGRQKARSLVQNNPYANRIVSVITANTVGPGIVAKISGRNQTITKQLNVLWKELTESSKIDFENTHDFYGLQALIMRSMAESGEGIAVFRKDFFGPQIQLLESDFIATDLDDGSIKQGIEVDSNNRKIAYHLYKKHPGENTTVYRTSTSDTLRIPAIDVAQLYRQDRPGQLRGITFFHAVAEKLKDLEDYQHASLIAKKISACHVGFITNNGQDSLVSASTLKEKRESEFAVQPGLIKYLGKDEDIKFNSPPSSDGYSEFVRETLRAITTGVGVSYEAVTNDYSQSNYSSSRLGNIEFRRNIDMWRWGILIPQFCNPYFEKFLEWARDVKGIDTKDATVQWVPPAHQMIDPAKEIDGLKKEVRAGFKTYGQAVREQGLDPDEQIKEHAEWNQKFDDLKLVFDTDARKLSIAGQIQQSPSSTPQGEGNSQDNEDSKTETPDEPA